MKKVVILIVLCSILLMMNGCSVKKTKELTDAEKFANEYSISDENPFQYVTVNEILELFEHKSGILFLGDSDGEWSTFGAKVLNKVLKEEKIGKVYYFNPESRKNRNNKKYKEVMRLLNFNDESTLPIVYIISDGKIKDKVSHTLHENSSMDQDSAERLANKYLNLILQYQSNV